MTPSALKALRAHLGWTQQQMAEALGVQRNTVNRWEMGLYPIPPMARKLLATLVKFQALRRGFRLKLRLKSAQPIMRRGKGPQ